MKDCFFDFDYDRNGYTPCDDYETCDECPWYADPWYADVLDDDEEVDDVRKSD